MGKRGKVPANKLPIAKTSVAPAMVNASPEDMKWKARDALSTIERANEHMQDEKLMTHVKAMAKEKMEALKKVCK